MISRTPGWKPLPWTVAQHRTTSSVAHGYPSSVYSKQDGVTWITILRDLTLCKLVSADVSVERTTSVIRIDE
jgi:hypothetical protein